MDETAPQKKSQAKAIIGLVVTLVGLTATSIYLVAARIGPVGWLVAKQGEWFDGKYYPKATFTVVFTCLALCLGLVATVTGWLVSLVRPRS